MTCSYDGCDTAISHRTTSGLCRKHYRLTWGRKNYDPAKAAENWRKYGQGARRYERHLMYAYGITPDEFDAMVQEQDGRCYLCESLPNPNAKHPANRVLHMDHNHATGKPRRPLCTDCNKGLGMFKDDPELLRKAAEYLCATNR